MSLDRGGALFAALACQCGGAAVEHRRTGCRQGDRAHADRSVKLIFSERAWSQYLPWQTEDSKLYEHMHALIGEAHREPFRGTGEAEPLGGNLSGWWSRRINSERRLVYRVSGRGEA